jgi:hypothetical protein
MSETVKTGGVEEVTSKMEAVQVAGEAAITDQEGVYTSEERGNDESGEGTYKVPFKSVIKAMKHAGKEPFPQIFVDPKPESEAAKSGKKI